MDETKKQLFEAQSIEEVSQILKERGVEEDAEKIWRKISDLREKEGKNLSLNELEAVAGGTANRDWLKDGCAATVEPDSNCWSNDGGCMVLDNSYAFKPCYTHCVGCGAKYTYQSSFATDISGGRAYKYECRECGKTYYYNSRHGKWEEYIW